MGLQRVRWLRDWACKQHVSTGPFGKFTIKKLNDSLRLSCLKLMAWITNNLVKNCRTEISLTYDSNIEVFSRQPKLMDTLFIKLSKPCLRFFFCLVLFFIFGSNLIWTFIVPLSIIRELLQISRHHTLLYRKCQR